MNIIAGGKEENAECGTMNDELKSFDSAFIIHCFAFSSLPPAIECDPFRVEEQSALTEEFTIGEHHYDSDTLFSTPRANSLKS